MGSQQHDARERAVPDDGKSHGGYPTDEGNQTRILRVEQLDSSCSSFSCYYSVATFGCRYLISSNWREPYVLKIGPLVAVDIKELIGYTRRIDRAHKLLSTK